MYILRFKNVQTYKKLFYSEDINTYSMLDVFQTKKSTISLSFHVNCSWQQLNSTGV